MEPDEMFNIVIKVIKVGEHDVCFNSYLDTLTVTDQDVDGLREKISTFISGTDWLFVITDVESSLAEKVAECIKEFKSLPTSPSFSIPYFSMPLEITESGTMINRGELLHRKTKCPLVTSIILCPSAEDARLKNINSDFGTRIILPKDKIAATGLTNDEIIYQVIEKITCIVPMNCLCLIGMDFIDVVAMLENQGRACIGFGESLDAENNSLAAVKNALKSPLFIEAVGKAKKGLLVFFGNNEFLSMMDVNEAVDFFNGELRQSKDIWDEILWQVVSNETANDGVTVFVLATNFEK